VARLETTTANLARVKPLAEKNAVSQKDLDDATGAYQSAKAELEAADANLKTAKAQPRLHPDHLADHRHCRHRQGPDRRPAEPEHGDRTDHCVDGRSDQGLFQHQRTEYLKIATAASSAGKTAQDVPLDLILVDGSIYPHKGKVSVLNRQVDVATGTFKVAALFPNPGQSAAPGQYGRIRATMSVKGALLVPQRAVTEMQGKYLLAVVGADNKVDIRPVVVGERIGSDWIIAQGAEARREGDRRRDPEGQAGHDGQSEALRRGGPGSWIRPERPRRTRSPGRQGVSRHVQVFHQPADRGHGHLDPDDHHRHLVAMSGLPIAQFPNIVPPQIQVNSTYTGADALTVEQAVATPIEQQMSGVDNMDYMYSINANNGQSTLYVNFALGTDANTDQLLAQMREGQAESQLPSDVRNYGVTVQKSTSSPLVMFALYSPNGTYDNVFLANYAYININDQMTRVKGIASVTVFGAGQYAMRLWVARPAGQAEHHDSRDHQRRQRAEHGQPGRNDRRRAGAAGPGVHLCGARPGPAADRRGLRQHRAARQPGRLDRPRQRCRPHRTRRADLQPWRAGSTANRRR
jgi:hypothetical protein